MIRTFDILGNIKDDKNRETILDLLNKFCQTTSSNNAIKFACMIIGTLFRLQNHNQITPDNLSYVSSSLINNIKVRFPTNKDTIDKIFYNDESPHSIKQNLHKAKRNNNSVKHENFLINLMLSIIVIVVVVFYIRPDYLLCILDFWKMFLNQFF